MKTTKTIFFAIKVVLLSLLATSCIPTVPGGNPTPNNTFNVNIDNKDVKADPDNPKYTTVLVDGDTLLFAIFHTLTWLDFTQVDREHISIGFQPSTGHTYEFYNLINYPEFTSTRGLYHTLGAGVTVGDTPDSTHEWIPFESQQFYTTSYDNEILFSQTNGNPISFDPRPYWEGAQDAFNQDRFIVFRRLKGTAYQYYWVRIKMLDKSTVLQYLILGLPLPTTFIYDGKYQMNSITTGQ
jgi:hypothetical protein